MDISGFKVEEFLPHYLTADQKIGLAKALADFSSSSNLYSSKFPEDTLQGDCWEGVPYYDFRSGTVADAKAVLLSNSCDMDQNNPRDFPVLVTYAPLLSYAKYEAALRRNGNISEASISGKMDAIRNQRMTNMVYIPAGQGLEEDCIAMLDRASSVPYSMFIESRKKKLFSLNQLGHYLLSFKLSVHFCRLHEGIIRGEG